MTKPFTVQNYLTSLTDLAAHIDAVSIEKAINLILETAETGKKIITCGNGGSAAAASHYITDWNKMFNLATGRPFRGLSLCDNIGLVTAYANDLSYDDIFQGQLKAVMDPGDLVLGISGSGNSPNVLKAFEYAKANGARTLGILGYDGGKAIHLAEAHVLIPCFDMQLCEDFHMVFGHMVMKSICSTPIK